MRKSQLKPKPINRSLGSTATPTSVSDRPTAKSFRLNLGSKDTAQPIKQPRKPLAGFEIDHSQKSQDIELVYNVEGNVIHGNSLKIDTKKLVIPVPKNSRPTPSGRASNNDTGNGGDSSRPSIDTASRQTATLNDVDSEQKYGLQVVRKRKQSQGAEREPQQSTSVSTPTDSSVKHITSNEAAITEPLTDEQLREQAINALQNGEIVKTAETIAINVNGGDAMNGYERISYRESIKDLPDEATEEDYERVPVEDFGAALLRGMGWDESESTTFVDSPNPRPSLLGLGAKPSVYTNQKRHKRP